MTVGPQSLSLTPLLVAVAVLALSACGSVAQVPRSVGGRVLFEVAEGPFACPAGDVDLDGVPDIAVASRNLAMDCEERPNRVTLYSGQTGLRIRVLTGGEGFGQRILPAGDVDADGFPDLCIQSQRRDGPILFEIYSGRTGEVVRKLQEEWGSEAFAGLGDIDGDGYADFATAEAREQFEFGCTARSGRDGSELWKYAFLEADSEPWPPAARKLVRRIDPSRKVAWWRLDLSSIGDIDRDGIADLALIGPGPSGPFAVHIISARHGRPQFIWDGWTPDALPSPGVVAGAGDIDGDTVPDIVIGLRESQEACVISGLDGAVIHRVAGDRPDDDFGSTVAGLDDVDGDGVSDFAVGAKHFHGWEGCAYVRVFSGRDARPLLTIDGSAEDGSGGPMDVVGVPHAFGICLWPLGDVNGDGCPDLLVGEDQYSNMGCYGGDRVVIVSACVEPDQPHVTR